MKFNLTLLIFLFSFLAKAQRQQQLSLDLNRSFHGTGDLVGPGFNVEYGRYLTGRLELTAGLGANVFGDAFPVQLISGGQTMDASYRMVTGGLQFNGQVNIAPLRTRFHEMKLALGPLLRYQSSSAAGGYSVTYPPATNYPEPVFTFRHYEDQNVLTVGYMASVSYAYTFARGFLLGAKASFQNDTNEDVITQYGLRIGKRF